MIDHVFLAVKLAAEGARRWRMGYGDVAVTR